MSVHWFRHTGIMHGLNVLGIKPSIIQAIARHKDFSSTKLYTHADASDLKREEGKIEKKS